MKNKFLIYLAVAVFFVSSSYLYAQVEVNSPYSHYGIGDIYSNRTAYSMSMGGLSSSLKSNLYVNYLNPASYNGFDSTSFIFEGGLISDFVFAQTDSLSTNSVNSQLGYLMLGFPVSKWCKASIGLTPFSSLGYLVYDEKNLEDIGPTQYIYEAFGGLNRVYGGAAFTIKNLSLGVNASYLFGTLNYDKVIDFPDSIYIVSFRLRNDYRIRDFLFDFGIQYDVEIAGKYKLTLGGVYSAQTDLKSFSDVLALTYFPGQNDVDFIKDTVEYIDGEKGTIRFPMKYSAGFIFEDAGHWMVGADYSFQKWEDYRKFGLSDSLNNSMKVSVGGYYLPQPKGIPSYWELIQYRFGFRYHKTYLELRNNQINEFGVTFGVGLPLRNTRSTINLAVEWGQSGTIKNGLIKENILRFTLGISLYERWFIKRKFY